MNQVQQNLVQMGILRALQEQQQQGKIFIKYTRKAKLTQGIGIQNNDYRYFTRNHVAFKDL